MERGRKRDGIAVAVNAECEQLRRGKDGRLRTLSRDTGSPARGNCSALQVTSAMVNMDFGIR